MLNDEQFDELADKLLKKIAPKLGVELEEEKPKSSTVVRDKDGEMKTTITQEARTGVYTITTKDTDLIALLDQGIVEKAPVTMIKPMTYGVVSPGVYTVPGHKMQEILENRPMDYL